MNNIIPVFIAIVNREPLRVKKVKKLKKMKVYLNMSPCMNFPLRPNGEKQFLLFASKLPPAQWQGDSGGPLIRFQNNFSNPEVIGIATHTRYCNSSGVLSGVNDVYQRVSKYVNWIMDSMEMSSGLNPSKVIIDPKRYFVVNLKKTCQMLPEDPRFVQFNRINTHPIVITLPPTKPNIWCTIKVSMTSVVEYQIEYTN